MRVLYCGLDEHLGGIESFVLNMYTHFDKSKIKVDFLKITDSIFYEEEFLKNGSIIYKIPSRKSNPIKFYIELIKFFKKHSEYKVIHHHLNSCSSIDPIIIAKLFRRKTIAHSHNVYKGNRMLTNFLHNINKEILPFFADINIACSDSAGRDMFKNNPFQVVNNGIDLQKYIYDPCIRNKYREELGLEDKFVLGHIGNFKYQKNHDFLIEIFKEVHAQNSNAVLVLIGDGELRPEIEEKICELNLTSNVIFTGVRTDVPKMLQALDVFVFPSRYEGLGIVLIEAQASGLPSVVANTIPNDAILTDLVDKVILKEKNTVWAKKVLKYSNSYQRNNTYEEIKSAGYDSFSSAKLLEEIYLE